jgi:putative FmdB family regulatory protein
MPIYEYQCQNCATEVEVLQKISDAPLQDCPECGEASLRKKVSAAAFRLKGSGWYETDFKSGGKKNLAGGSDAPGSSGSKDNAGSTSDKSGSTGNQSGGSSTGDKAKSA